jgi:bifunctional UDP-N-acetylglucosamine pyrophosphorylase/glucosamine-1-phosphate N-acetyltransferase
MAEPILRGRSDQILVAYGDMPLLRAESIARLAQMQAESKAAVAILTVMGDPASTFGRVIRDESGRVAEIVEVAQTRQRPNMEDLLAVREHNAGVYCFAAEWLWDHLPELPVRQARTGQEYYLTDMIGLAVAQEYLVAALTIDDADECLGAGTRSEMVAVEKAFRRRANKRWLAAGVTLIDPETTYIDQSVTIGRDTTIWPNTFLQGETIIGGGCHLGPNSIVRNSHIGDGCRIEQAMVEDSVLSDGTDVRPFDHVKGQRQTRGAAGQ